MGEKGQVIVTLKTMHVMLKYSGREVQGQNMAINLHTWVLYNFLVNRKPKYGGKHATVTLNKHDV